MKITNPLGFITDTSPLIEWSGEDGGQGYNLKITNNVTGEVLLDMPTNGVSYQVPEPLELGTYSIEVKNDLGIDIQIVTITDIVATYTIVGREGDKNYLAYKEKQKSIRQQASSVAGMLSGVLATNADIMSSLAQSGDEDLVKYHGDTIDQTPGLRGDLQLYLSLAYQITEVMRRIRLRDPQF